MMDLQTFTFGTATVELYVPDPAAVRHQYEASRATAELPPFPYWARLWPSARAMAAFLETHRTLIAGKKVLELAAGLGLPGLLAAQWAREVTISDYLPEAVGMIKASFERNGYTNVVCRELNWYHLPPGLDAEVVLLSDINYDPAAFQVLFDVLQHFMKSGATIILTTPQRLMAKPFIERLLPCCRSSEEIAVEETTGTTYIQVMVLRDQEK